MGGMVYCLPVALLFLAGAIPSEAQKGAGAGDETRVTVAAGAPLTVECRLRPEQRAEWQRDGAAPPPDLRAEPEAAADARLAARLTAPAAREHHAGLYTCSRARDHRVRVVVLPGAAAAAASGEAPATEAAAAPPAVVGAGGTVVRYDLRGPITLTCGLANAAGLAYAWTKNETDVTTLDELKGRYQLRNNGAEYFVSRSVEDDWGNYSCGVGGELQRWELQGRPHLKVAPDTSVVEGQKLKVQCKVIGKPYPRVSWEYSNDTVTWVDVSAALDGRAALAASEQGVEGGALTVAAAARSDAGHYRCTAPDAAPAATLLRVKDMYAALWPFLGICAEVFVLCAVILVYERRRTKPEAEDSDADTDQKKS